MRVRRAASGSRLAAHGNNLRFLNPYWAVRKEASGEIVRLSMFNMCKRGRRWSATVRSM